MENAIKTFLKHTWIDNSMIKREKKRWESKENAEWIKCVMCGKLGEPNHVLSSSS